MIELSSSWELQGRRKLSDVLYIKEMRLDHEAYDTDESDLVLADASIEFASKPVVLQPFLHPEVSSVGACCIMIRLSTQRQLRIVQLVLISSSPHIEFVDRYGEPLARIEGILVPDAEEELYRCSSGHLSPHTECVVRFSEVHHLDPLVIQHIGVYTTCPVTSSLVSHTEQPSTSHTQEIIKLSSFLNATSDTTSSRDLCGSRHPPLSHSIGNRRLHISKSTVSTSTSTTEAPSTTTAATTEEPQRGKSASSPAAIPSSEEGFVGCRKATSLQLLCRQFLTSMYGTQQTTEFWQECATSLFASLIRLSLGDQLPDQKHHDFRQHMRSIFEAATRENPPQRETGSEESDHHQESQPPPPPAAAPPPHHRHRQEVVIRSLSEPPTVSPSLPHSGSISTMTNPSSKPTCPSFGSGYEGSLLFSICTLGANLNELRQTTSSQLAEILKRLSNLETGTSKKTDRPQFD